MNGVPYMTIKDTSTATGLSQYLIRRLCKEGRCPHIRSGEKYLVNVEALLEKLDEQSRETKGTAS